MITIEIRKYTARTGGIKNYFDKPVYIDKIIFNDILEDGIPAFDEAHEDEFETFGLLASDYDFKFSFLQTEVSDTGLNIEQFINNDIGNYILAVRAIKTNGKIIGGIIDITTVNNDYTITENNYDISFTAYSYEKEFSEFTSAPPRVPSYVNNTFSSYVGGTNGVPLFNGINNSNVPLYIKFDFTNLNWTARGAFEPVLIHELWAYIVNDGRASGCSTWKLFEDLIKTFGIQYDFKIETGYSEQYFKIKVYLLFADTGYLNSAVKEIDIIKHNTGYEQTEAVNEIIIFKFSKQMYPTIDADNNEPDEARYGGFIFDKTEYYNMDWFINPFVQQERFYVHDNYIENQYAYDSPFYLWVSETKVKVIEMNYYFDTRFFIRFQGTVRQWNWFVLNEPGEIYTGMEMPMFWNSVAQYISFPRLFTKPGYEFRELSGGEHWNGSKITVIFQPNDNIHNVWELLLLKTLFRVYKYLVTGTLYKTLHVTITMIEKDYVNLFDKTTVNGIDYICKNVRNGADEYEEIVKFREIKNGD